MIDMYPGKPATATAATNLTRCLLGAGASAVVIPLSNAIGIGWTCTLASAIWAGLSCPVLLLLMKVGPKWRKADKEKKDAARAEKKEVSKQR